ncbi:hypothetical protein KKE03_04385 [Patescibacteria group bacterium]|nr:hypothetical protein [Patescibacteria group bacterium]
MANEIQEGLPSSGAGTSIATLEKGTDVATPEERIGEWWQEHFGGSKQESPPLSEEIQTAEIPAATEAAPPGQEPPAGGGEGSNGGPEEPGGPEGPRGPDYLWSSEFRAKRFSVVKKIIALESLPYAEQYNSGNQFKLEKLYEKWKELEALDNKKSYLRKPFNPTEFEEAAEVTQPKRYESQDLTDLPLVEELFDILNHPVPIDPQGKEAWENEVANARNNVSKYFKEAHNQGLLDSIDDSLRSVALEIQQGLDQGLSPDAIMTGIEESWSRGIEGKVGVGRRIAAIEDMAKRTFQAARRANPEIGKLEGVWDVYIQLALDRLTLLFDPNRPRPLPIEGGFTFEAEEGGEFKKLMDEGEIYWRPTYANYFTVYARNEEQFERARETFIRWMRSGLGKSPEELIQKVNGFKEALTSAGQRAGLQEYTVEKRQELEALMGVIVANFFNEQYNVDYFKQGWTWVSQHEGPARMLELIKTSRGVTAAIIYKFDKDPRFELLFSPHGRRGQLMGRKRNAIEMGALQKEISEVWN